MSEFASLSLAIADGIADLRLTGPGKGNAMGPDFWRELPVAMAAIGADPAVRVVVLSGAGANFSFGLDLMAMMPDLGPVLTGPQLAAGRTRLLGIIEQMQGAITSVERCPKPVIAAIAGWCIGGGVDLSTACDVRLCSADARFSVREVRVAMVADVGTLQRLPRIVGQGHARELALSGRDIDAAEAARIGLVNRVYADPDALRAGALELAAEIAGNPPLVVQGTKRVMNWSADHPSSDGLAYVAAWNAAFLQSEDLAEALAAFVERRPPRFKGA